MSSYEGLDALIVDLKIARINAWMRSKGWQGGGATQGGWSNEYGGPYRAVETVSGTDANGEGGGAYEGWTEDTGYWSNAFDEIRSAVDEHLSPWRTLPDPAVIQDWIDPMRLAISEIAISAIDQDGGPTGGGEIVGAIEQEVRDMCSTYLPAVARHLFRASNNVSDSYFGSIFTDFHRGAEIGIDSNGPMEEWGNIWLITRDLLVGLAEETKASATTLDLAMSDIGQQDTDARDALEKHATASREIGRGDHFPLFWDDFRDPDA